MSNPHGTKVFFQARVLRLCPRRPWQVGPVQRMWWRTQKLNHAAHKQLPGKRLPPWKRDRRNFLHPPRVLQSALSGPSEMWDGAYFNRNPPVTQTHKHQLAVLRHDYVTRQDQQHVCWRTNRPALQVCVMTGSTNPHTLILCATLLYLWGRTTATVSKHVNLFKPITAMKRELVILTIIDLYQHSVNVQHTTGSCAGSIAYITCRDCRHTNAEEHRWQNRRMDAYHRKQR